ncbi:MAG: imelysin [Bacteroidales bacterium]|nr:imelysin [Bacteroidales bacterium]
MRRFMNFICAAAVAVAPFILVSCNPEDNTKESEAEKQLKAAVEEYVPDVIYEIYGNLADATSKLYDQLAAFKAKGLGSASQSDIDAICATFLDARAQWEASEAFLYGAATVYGIDPHIDTWPLNKDKLAKELSNAAVIADLDEEGARAADEVGVSNLGFHGIEFILFRDGANRKLSDLKGNEKDETFAAYKVSGADEIIFATAVAEDLRNYCWQLQAAWDPDAPEDRVEYVEEELELNTVMDNGLTFGENMLAATKPGSTMTTWQRAVSTILVAGCSNICNEVANSKIASAYYATDPDYIESPYSKKSYTDFLNNLLSIQYSLYGKAGASTPSKDCIMKVLGNQKYSGVAALQSALDEAVKALNACVASGVAFVDDPDAACAAKAMETLNTLDAELNKAADFVETL